MLPDLQRCKDWADLVLKVVSSIAIVVGGIWAYYNFVVLETTASNIQVNVTSEHWAYGDRCLLVAHAKARNIGKVLVQAGKRGFVVTVRQFGPGLAEGTVDLQKLSSVGRSVNVANYAGGYELEPGVEYVEPAVFVVVPGASYVIRAELDLGGGDLIDQTVVVRINKDCQ